MELFIWLWAYDKRLLCSLRHSYTSFVYIWLVPVVMAATVLAFAYLAQTTDMRDMRSCFTDDEVAANGRVLSKLVLIQEGLLVSIIFAGVATSIQADSIYKRQPIKALPVNMSLNPQTNCENETVSYDFWLRLELFKSCTGILMLVLAICNLAFSTIFALGFHRYHTS